MLLAAVLGIQPSTNQWWNRPSALRAFAYALLAREDSVLAEQLHHGEGPRPFTIAVLASEPREVLLRVTTLNETAAHALVGAASMFVGGAPLVFGGARVRGSTVTLDEPPAAGVASYEELLGHPFQAQVGLRFSSPTAFAQAGELVLPLPHPVLMLQSWALRWNRFAPEALRFPGEILTSVGQKLAVSRARISTEPVDLAPGKIVGFTGVAALQALKPDTWGDEERTLLAALSAYSRFCGTGIRTAQGMGVTVEMSEKRVTTRRQLTEPRGSRGRGQLRPVPAITPDRNELNAGHGIETTSGWS